MECESAGSSSPERTARKPGCGVMAAALALGTFAGLGLAELGARAWFASGEIFRSHPMVRRTFLPDQDRDYTSRESGLRFRLRTNSLGFRGPQPSPPSRDPGRPWRVAVVGDSFTSQIQIPEETTLVGRLRNRTVEGRALETWNFGIDGSHPARELLVLEEFVFPLEPDLVVLQLYLQNDIHEGHPGLTRAPSAWFELDAAGKLVFHRPPLRARLASWLDANSRLYMLQKHVTEILKKGRQPAVDLGSRASAGEAATRPRSAWARPGAPRSLPVDDLHRAYLPLDPVWTEALRLFRALVAEFVSRCRARGIQVVLVRFPLVYEVIPEFRDFLRATHSQIPADQWDFAWPGREFARLAGELGVPAVETAPLLEALSAQEVPFFGDPAVAPPEGHLTARASEVVLPALEAAIRVALTTRGPATGSGSESGSASRPAGQRTR